MKTMKSFRKTLYLILSLLPYIAIATILILIFTGIAQPVEQTIQRGQNTFLIKDPTVTKLGIMFFAAIPLQWIFYIVNVFRNPTVSKNERILWIPLLLGGHIFVSPFYWYFHIWKDKSQDTISSSNACPAITPHKEKGFAFKSRQYKIILLLASLLPLISMILAGLTVAFTANFNMVYVFGVLYYISFITLDVLYIIDICRNPEFTSSQRLLWGVMIIFANIVIYPVYWYIYIWKNTAVPEPAPQTVTERNPGQ